MSETSFWKTWKALLPFIVTVRPMTECRVPTHETLLDTGLVDNKHAHYYGTDNMNNIGPDWGV